MINITLICRSSTILFYNVVAASERVFCGKSLSYIPYLKGFIYPFLLHIKNFIYKHYCSLFTITKNDIFW